MGALLNLRLQQHATVGALFAVAPILALTITNLPKATARIPRALPITTYYLDSHTGKDENSGTSPHAPWKTLDRAGRAELQPGDRLLLSTRAPLRGCLRLKRTTGALGQPVRISSYGAGRAQVEAGNGDGILLEDCSHIAVEKLRVVGSGRKSGNDGAGIQLLRTRGVTVSDIEVSGFRLGGVTTGGDEDTRLLRIHAHDNGFAGIAVNSDYDGMPRSRNLYIGHCVTENNPGDPKNLTGHSGNGIVVGGADGAVVEFCVATNNGWDMPREGNGPVGIWGWNSDRLTIQSCISHHNRSPGMDGGGFDLDGGVTNSVMQYNLSYENDGCGYLLCQYPGARPWKNNVVRYNISFNDGSRHFQSGIGLWLGDSGIQGALIHNNTIVNTLYAVRSFGDLPEFEYRDNIFLAGGDVLHGPFTKSRFRNNLYWSRNGGAIHSDDGSVHKNLDDWRAAGNEPMQCIFTDPKVLAPQASSEIPKDPKKLARMEFFRLLPGSPSIGAGSDLRDRGPRDFFGKAIPPGKPSIGAHEPR